MSTDITRDREPAGEAPAVETAGGATVEEQLSPERWPRLPRDHRAIQEVPVHRLEAAPGSTAPSDGDDGGTAVLSVGEDSAVVRFRHHAPQARAVALAANGFGHPVPRDACDLRSVGEGWWETILEVPADWRTSYGFAEHQGAGDPPWWKRGLKRPGARVVADATVPRGHDAGRGGGYRSVLSVPDDGPFPPVPTEPGPALHELPTGPEEPEVRWWAPRPGDPGCADLDPATPLPLLIVVDGEQHADQLGTPELVRRGISAGALPPLAAVFVTSGPDRPDVLGVPDGHARWIAETLVPRLRTEGLHACPEGPSQGAAVTVTSDPARTVLTGSSFGGLTTLFGVAWAPEQIGVGIAQSVSLWRYAEGSLVRPLQLAARRAPLRLRLHAGRYEGTMPEQAGRLVEALREDGADATLEVFTGGHDWAWWQPMMLRELATVLG